MSGATTGKMGVYVDENIAYLNQRVGNLKIKSQKILPNYRNFILYFLKELILYKAYGTAQPNISKPMLESLKIPLPPLEIQTQIVSECEKVEEQYNTIRMSIEEYQKLIKTILVKTGICEEASISGGDNTSFSSLENIDTTIALILKELQGLESKLDFAFLESLACRIEYSEVSHQSIARSATESRPLRGAEIVDKGGATASARLELEAEERGTPLDCRKSGDFFGVKGSGEGINPFLRKEIFLNNNTESNKDTLLMQVMTEDLNTLLDSLPTPPKEGWERVKLSNVCRINEKTYNPSNEADKEYIYIDIDSVEKGTGKFSTDNKLLASNLPTRARRLADDDSVIISTVRPYLKGFAYIGESIKDSIFSTGFAILKGNERLKSKFIYILFMFSNDLMKQMEEKMPKASYPSINADDIKAFQIPLPPLEIQTKITQSIETIQSQISFLDSALPLLQSQKQEVLKKYLF